ncbi:MAG TPA: sigma-70 family RNA polymerase sigma factor [Puia sp.]
MSAHFLPINDILIYYCNQQLNEPQLIESHPASLPESKGPLLDRYEDGRYISGKLRRLQRVDRQVEWAKVVAAIHKDSIIYLDFSASQFLEGSLRDFNVVFDGLYDTMYVFAYNLIWASRTAQDIATEVFVKCWHSRAAFETLPTIKTFLYKATRDGCLDYLARLRKEQLVEKKIYQFLTKNLKDEAYLKDQIVNAEIFSELLRGIDSLPLKCREVVMLTYFKSYSADEVAGQLQTSSRDVLHQKARGVRILRTSFLKKALLPPQEYFLSLI